MTSPCIGENPLEVSLWYRFHSMTRAENASQKILFGCAPGENRNTFGLEKSNFVQLVNVCSARFKPRSRLTKGDPATNARGS
jgi:hypothetical protein